MFSSDGKHELGSAASCTHPHAPCLNFDFAILNLFEPSAP
jgi:hypothetical protein